MLVLLYFRLLSLSVMAWSRLLTFTPAIFILRNKVNHSLFNKLRHGYQIALFHNSILVKNKEALEAEIKEDLNSTADLNSEIPDENISSLKLKILHAGLNYVPEHGWTKESIALGAQSLDLSPASHSLIQAGGADLVHYFNFLCNENLNTYLEEKSSENAEKVNIQNYLEDALENRLKMVVPFVSRWSEAMSLMISPTELPADLENLLNLVDTIYCHSAANPLDATWYTKRISLAITYKLCELSLVQDKSIEFSDSFEFLQRRVEMVINTDNFFKDIALASRQLPHYSIGALITARNILGMNRWSK